MANDITSKEYTPEELKAAFIKMYGGDEEKVTLRCSLEILDQVIDQFGDGIKIKGNRQKNTKDKNGKPTGTFTITVPVSLSTTFYAWVFQYVGKMKIEAPEYVRQAYADYLKQAMDGIAGE